jgi:arsenite methyltransferase
MAEQLREKDEIREAVRERYAAAANALGSESATGCCGESSSSCGDGSGCGPSSSSLGCGNPTAVAELHPGETVIDLGSGGGEDVLLSAQRVGPSGKAFGVDMTDEMLELARRNQREAGVDNVEFVKGTIEDVPLPDDSVDVVISNCVINLAAEKGAVFGEAVRVLRRGGRFAVTDIVADPEMDDATRRDLAQWTGCIAGALTESDFRRQLEAAGFEEIEIRETHRVHEHAGSAIIRASLPA